MQKTKQPWPPNPRPSRRNYARKRLVPLVPTPLRKPKGKRPGATRHNDRVWPDARPAYQYPWQKKKRL